MQAKRLGNISLIAFATLWLSSEVIFHNGTAPPWFCIVCKGLEAGTIGGLADWFAVSALFHYIPIPVLSKHTDILVKQRANLKNGIIDLLQNQWLSADSITEWIQNISFSSHISKYLLYPENFDLAKETLVSLILKQIQTADISSIADDLSKVMHNNMQKTNWALEIAGPLSKAIENQAYKPIQNQLLSVVHTKINEPEFQVYINRIIEKVADKYESSGFWKGLTIWAAEKTGGIEYNKLAAVFIAKISEELILINNQPEHVINIQLKKLLIEFIVELQTEDHPNATNVNELVTNLFSHEAIYKYLQKYLIDLQNDSNKKESFLVQSIEIFINKQLESLIEKLKTDDNLNEALNSIICSLIIKIIQQNNNAIAQIVESNLSEEKLPNEKWRSQIEDKVGKELQYIRLNGAIVGGMIGLIIGGVKYFLALPQ